MDLRSLFCHFGFLCKKSKRQKLQEKALSRFEDQLDIRSFVKVYTNLALLLPLLFTREQRTLFEHHRRRAISLSDDSDEEDLELKLMGNCDRVGITRLLGYPLSSRLDHELLCAATDPIKASNKSSLPPGYLSRQLHSFDSIANLGRT